MMDSCSAFERNTSFDRTDAYRSAFGPSSLDTNFSSPGLRRPREFLQRNFRYNFGDRALRRPSINAGKIRSFQNRRSSRGSSFIGSNTTSGPNLLINHTRSLNGSKTELAAYLRSESQIT